MAVSIESKPRRGIHPVHAALLAGSTTLFLGALLSDWAYWSSYQVQWLNFASWLIAGGLVLLAAPLVFALVAWLRAARRDAPRLAYFLLLLATWLLGLIDALVHARDAWASMPAGLVLSAIVTLLAMIATWMGLSTLRTRGSP